MKIVIDKFEKENIPHYGNKFLNGNGYFGIRGTMEEYEKEHMPAFNMAGIYDRVGNLWRESVNAPNPLYTVLFVDGKKIALPETEPDEHYQVVDIEKGIHTRKTIWNTPKGNIEIFAERFASMDNQHIVAMKYSVSADFDCDIEIVTGIDGDVWDINGPHFKELKCTNDGAIKMVCGTTGELKIDVETKEMATINFEAERKFENADKKSVEHIKFKAVSGREYVIEKLASVSTSKDNEIFKENKPCDISVMSYDEVKKAHIEAWKKIWDISMVKITGDSDAQIALNYSLYHLNCIAPRNMKAMSIPARGLSGQVYKGAVFWDTEMFMIDYFLFTEPEIVKTILKYRINTLNGAKQKAKEYGYDGAFYAWESHDDGIDACSDYNVTDVFTKRPMRTYFRDKQVHISAAVAYAFDKYIKVTGDESILSEGGADVLDACAKFYASMLLKKYGSVVYEIHDVVGPDEYHERINNNVYTNKMAQFTLKTAAKYLGNKEYEELAEKIYIKAPDKNNIIEQFDGYFKLEDCSVDDVRGRLLDPREYWGGAYGVASDTKIIKQADVVAMLSMFADEYDNDVLLDNLKYYEPRTEHGSSLSACMYSLLSCKTGDAEFAYPFFMKSAGSDLKPGGKEWAGLVYIGGTHPAAEGGAWKVLVQGFAGMTTDGELKFKPKLPKNWEGVEFKVLYKDKINTVKITQQTAEIK